MIGVEVFVSWTEVGSANFAGASGPTVCPVLEPLPKWSLVQDIMEVLYV